MHFPAEYDSESLRLMPAICILLGLKLESCNSGQAGEKRRFESQYTAAFRPGKNADGHGNQKGTRHVRRSFEH